MIESYENKIKIFRVEMFIIIIDDDILNFVEIDIKILFQFDIDINIINSFNFIH